MGWAPRSGGIVAPCKSEMEKAGHASAFQGAIETESGAGRLGSVADIHGRPFQRKTIDFNSCVF